VKIEEAKPFFNRWMVPSSIYIALAAGAGLPIRCHDAACDFSVEYLIIAAPLIALLPVLELPWRARLAISVLVLGGVYLAAFTTIATFPEFVFAKAYGGFFAAAIVYAYMAHAVTEEGFDGFARGFARVALAVLAFTAIYRLPEGLMDRDVSYLLNGPIVFGWLMGIGGLCAFFVAMKTRSATDWLQVAGLGFGVLMSDSKGPIIAFVLCAAFYYIILGVGAMRRAAKVVCGAFVLAVVGCLAGEGELLSGTRLGLLFEVVSEGTNASEGSVGVRAAAFEQALELALNILPYGIGPGEFAVHDPALMYPHNVHLEVLLEYGLLPFVAYGGLIAAAMYMANASIRTLILFVVICLSFSGDVSYLRFLLPLLFLPAVVDPAAHRAVVSLAMKNEA
jgi:hypothetical protein